MKISRTTRAALLALLATTPVLANPSGGNVAAGSATITGGPGQLTVSQQSHNAIINWQSFSIDAGETTRFIQPSANAATLNRVLGGNPSAIHGNLQANGRVFLINPNGILVGPGGVIQTRGFTASTRNISDEAFLSGGDLRFSGTSDAAIVNQGVIESAGGDIVLIARRVENTGTLRADGTAALAAGYDVLLSSSGAERVLIQPSALQNLPAATVESGGAITAARAELKAAGNDPLALAVNLTGLVRARSIAVDAGDGLAAVSGQIDASGATGGRVEILGTNTLLTSTARVSADSTEGTGGEILVGGDYQGANPAVRNALNTVVERGARLSADAGVAGDGGRVIVWADDTTVFSGTIFARGGSSSGNGGFAEVSGKKNLVYRGTADLTAATGTTGLLFLDPGDVTIDNTATAGFSVQDFGSFGKLLTAASSSATLNVFEVIAQLATANLQIVTDASSTGGNGDVFINADIILPSDVTTTFRIDAARDIIVNADVRLPSAPADLFGGSSLLFGARRDIVIGDHHVEANRIDFSSGRNIVAASGATLTADNQISLSAFANNTAEPGRITLTGATINSPHVALFATAADRFEVASAFFVNANPGTTTQPAPAQPILPENRTGLFVFGNSSGGGDSGGGSGDGTVPGTNGQTPGQATAKPPKLSWDEVIKDSWYLQQNPDLLKDKLLADIAREIDLYLLKLEKNPEDKDAKNALDLLYIDRRNRISFLTNPFFSQDDVLRSLDTRIEAHLQYLKMFPDDKDAQKTLEVVYAERRKRFDIINLVVDLAGLHPSHTFDYIKSTIKQLNVPMNWLLNELLDISYDNIALDPDVPTAQRMKELREGLIAGDPKATSEFVKFFSLASESQAWHRLTPEEKALLAKIKSRYILP
jgi:filamentous hemagglutinin family protein